MHMETYHTLLVRKYVAGMASAEEQDEIFRWLDHDALNWSSFLAIAVSAALNDTVTVPDIEHALPLAGTASAQHVERVKVRLHNLLSLLQRRSAA